MVKEYKVNPEKKKEIIKSQKLKHPKWKKRKWARCILIITIIIYLIIMLLPWIATDILVDLLGETQGIQDYRDTVEVILFPIFFVIVMPSIIIYLACLTRTCSDFTIGHLQELMLLHDEGIEYSYVCRYRNYYWPYFVLEIKYGWIKKIVYNKYHERLEIYGRKKLTTYSDDKQSSIDHLEEEDNEQTRIYLYYDNNEDFVKTLEEKTGLKAQIINRQEE